jgi:16S rRNA (guanine(966)-N(2))-methyltransferase RsmD
MLPLCCFAMRIIAGTFRSRTLEAPPGLATRPTSDRLRETLFNVLAPRIAGSFFLDLYAGSGAVGIEALSRGAAHVTFVERAPAALSALRDNLAKLGLTAGFRIHAGGVAAFMRKLKPIPGHCFDLVFLDPPYDEAQEYAATLMLFGGVSHAPQKPLSEGVGGFNPRKAMAKRNRALAPEESPQPTSPDALSSASRGSTEILAPDALIIAEHRRKQKLAERCGSLGRTRLLEQGDAALSFYTIRRAPEEDTPKTHGAH